MSSIPSLCASSLDLGDIFGFRSKADSCQSQIYTINPGLIRILLKTHCMDYASAKPAVADVHLELDQYLRLWQARVSAGAS